MNLKNYVECSLDTEECKSSAGNNLYGIKKIKKYRSNVIHKITQSNTPLKICTLPILHSSNPTIFQSYTFQSYTFQSYTLPISHSFNPTPFPSYTLSILQHPSHLTLFQSHSSYPTLFQSYTLPILHSPNLTLF